MRKTLSFILITFLLMLSGCSTFSIAITASNLNSNTTSFVSEKDDYNTLLNPNGSIGIVRHPTAAAYGWELKFLPSYDPASSYEFQIDLRSCDISMLDIQDRLQDLLLADFDSKTKWPTKLPVGFNPDKIMSLGKSPGLNVRELHNKGITGKGVGIAIIDQPLLVDHVEYKDRLKMYEEIHWEKDSLTAQMHGPAVASIAVGKNVGVAPGADLYFIATWNGTIPGNSVFDVDLLPIAKSIDRFVAVNKLLPKEKRIRVISISLGINAKMQNYTIAMKSIKAAEKQGIYVVYVDSDPFEGMGRAPNKNPDDFNSYSKGFFWKDEAYNNDNLLIPMDSRCVASPTGNNDYVFYSNGGMSWTVPYVAGLYALACQVKPDITPNVFWNIAFETSVTIKITDADNTQDKKEFGKLVNPVKLIERLERTNSK